MLRRIHQAYYRFTPFTEAEAWNIFRLAAIAESVGWTLLIIGICFDQLAVPWHHVPVAITGQIHGMLFLGYVMAVVITAPSLGWSLVRTVFAGLCSVPPYGSLLYEQVSAYLRDFKHFRQLRSAVMLWS